MAREPCPHCGSFNEREALFCDQCGRALRGSPHARGSGGRGGKLLLVVIVALAAWGIWEAARRPSIPSGPAPARARSPRSGRGGAPAPPAAHPGGPVAEPAGPDASAAFVRLEVADDEGRPAGSFRAVLVEPGVVYAWVGSIEGAARAWVRTTAGRWAVAGVIGHFEEIGTVTLALEGAGVPDGLPLLEAPLREGDAVRWWADGRWIAARVASVEATPSGWPVFVIEPGSPSAGVSFLLADGRIVGHAVPEGGSDRVPLVAARGRAGPMGWSLEDWNAIFYAGTARYHRREAWKAMERGRWREAIEHLEAGGRESSEELATAYRKLAESQRAAGLLESAVATLAEARGRFPDRADLAVLRARALADLGRLREAIGEIVDAIARHPDRRGELQPTAESWYAREATRLWEAGSPADAEGLLAGALDIFPDSASLWLELGRVQVGLRRFEEALASLGQAQAIDPEAPVASLVEEAEAGLSRPGSVLIRFDPSSSTIRSPVVLDGRLERTFIIDTGASYTVISPDMAAALGLAPDPAGPRVRIHTAGGVREAPVVRVRTVDLSGLVIEDLQVVVMEFPGATDIGLLGLDFLRHFRVTLDKDRGELRLERP